jgi:hypothetical protein
MTCPVRLFYVRSATLSREFRKLAKYAESRGARCSRGIGCPTPKICSPIPGFSKRILPSEEKERITPELDHANRTTSTSNSDADTTSHSWVPGNLTEALLSQPIFDSSQENHELYSPISTFLHPQ